MPFLYSPKPTGFNQGSKSFRLRCGEKQKAKFPNLFPKGEMQVPDESHLGMDVKSEEKGFAAVLCC